MRRPPLGVPTPWWRDHPGHQALRDLRFLGHPETGGGACSRGPPLMPSRGDSEPWGHMAGEGSSGPRWEALQPLARGGIPAGLREPYWILQSVTFWEDQEGVALINHCPLGSWGSLGGDNGSAGTSRRRSSFCFLIKGPQSPWSPYFCVQFSTHHFSCSYLHFLFYVATPEKVILVIL